MDLRLISTPLTRELKLSVVTVADVKAQARVSHNDEDELIASYIDAAYDFLSGPHGWLGNCCLLAEEFEFFVERTPKVGIELPMRPVPDENTVLFEVRAADGTYSAVDASLYTRQLANGYTLLRRAPGTSWPYFRYHPRAYRIRFIAGFGDATEIPSPIKQGIKLLAAHWYANRETVGPDGRTVGQEIEYGLKSLCGRFRVARDHS